MAAIKLKGIFTVSKTSDFHEKGDKTFEIEFKGMDRSEKITISGTSDDLAQFDYDQVFDLELTERVK